METWGSFLPFFLLPSGPPFPLRYVCRTTNNLSYVIELRDVLHKSASGCVVEINERVQANCLVPFWASGEKSVNVSHSKMKFK